jgi:hypothetical protein
MAVAKSPFYVIQNFLSPKLCEKIVDDLDFYSPDYDKEGNPVKMYRYKEDAELIVFNRLQPLIPKLMEYYDAEYRATETIQFEYFAAGVDPEPICENSNYVRKKWMRTKDRDITAVLFFSDYNDNPPFDSDYECYGGKLEFPQHGFGFNPQRGTLIVYPSGPHFINATSTVQSGDLIQARIHMATKLPYLYNPTQFPGDYRSWFSGL